MAFFFKFKRGVMQDAATSRRLEDAVFQRAHEDKTRSLPARKGEAIGILCCP